MPGPAAASLVFSTSALVLVLEILAGRVLAPYVGVSLESSTGIIGTVLAAISAGTWLGGLAADQVDPRRLLGPVLVAGGAATLLVVPAVSWVGPRSTSGSPVAIVTLATVGFFLPAAILSAVSPAVVKLRLRSLADTGGTVGRLSALGTFGALAGTFVTGFVLVATVPVRPLITGLGVATALAGLAVTWGLGRSRRDVAATAAVALAALLAGPALAAVAPNPCPHDSVYACARVERDPDRATGRLLWLDSVRNSYVDLADPTHLEFGYTRALAAVLDVTRPGEPLRVLHIGGGGFTMPRWLQATRPGSHSVVLEIDPALPDLARRHLGLRTGADLEVVTADARRALRWQPEGSFDVVIGDAFSGLQVPWHLTTVEVVRRVEALLRPGGVYALNLIDRPPQRFARAELATLAEVFDHVAVIAPPAVLTGDAGGNHVLVASATPLPVADLERRLGARQAVAAVATGDAAARFHGGARPLTDDLAPADQLVTR